MTMMLMQVPLEDGSDEFIEVAVDVADLDESVQLAAVGGSGVTRAGQSLARSLRNVLPALSTVLTTVRSAEHVPDDVSIKVGLTLGGETGVIFTKGTVGATFEVTMTWKRPQAGLTAPAAAD